MKKFIIGLLVLTVLGGCGQTDKRGNEGTANACSTLKVYNWGVYIGPEVKNEFEEVYNVKVIYDEFPSNEAMYTKLAGGEAYDVLYPSDYMIERLIEENYLESLNKEKLPNFKYLLPEVLNWEYDIDNVYSVPYFWGNVGLLYNKKKVSISDLEAEGFNIMLNEKYSGKIFVYNSERDAFMMALKALNYSMNTTSQKEIDEAYQWLLKQKQTMKPVYVEDDIIDNMVAGLKDIALMYSGDAAYVISENPDMDFFIPISGSNLWLDAMVIPANSKCADLAYQWINFQLDYSTAQANSEHVGYSSTVENVYYQMMGDDGEFEDNPAYQVRIDNENDEIFHYNAEIKKILSDLWTRVLAS